MTPEPQHKRDAASGPLGLYVHVPFCETKCPYCDFNTYAHIESLMAPYVRAVSHELALWGRSLGRPAVTTIFFGGGTPSHLGPGGLRPILEAADAAFDLEAVQEVTIECNPGDLAPERARGLAALPLVDRLSIGVQAFQDHHLALLGRRHGAAEAVEAYRTARRAGFENVNLDFMFGLPGQTLQEWRETLVRACRLRPEHLSLYCLTLELGTPLEHSVASGKVAAPDPDVAADQYELARELLRSEGYEHYEISNWSLPGLASKHNLIYWRNETYLGIGPGAHSHLAGRRFAGVKSPREYLRLVQDWWGRGDLDPQVIDEQALRGFGPVTDVESIGQAKEMGETMMMGLRLSEGVSRERFGLRFGVGLDDAYGPVIEDLTELGLLEWRGGGLRLTPEGQLLGNEVFQRFLVHYPAGVTQPS